MVQRSGGHKAVVVAHSMGGNFMLFFTQWVTAHRGPTWMHDHVHALVKLAVPALGVPKVVTALLSGESRDTAELGMLGALLDRHLPPRARARLFRSWGSAGSMLPKGGHAIWGDPWQGSDVPAPDFSTHDAGDKGQLAKGFLYLEDEALGAERAVEYLLEHAANETLAIDGQLPNFRNWSETRRGIVTAA